jgi:Tol biopolymer transport system component
MKRIGTCVAAALLTLAGCTSGGGDSSPTGATGTMGDAPSTTSASAAGSTSPLEHAIVFCRFLPGDDQGVLYRVDAGGSEEQRIREVTGDCPVLSPDGTRFAEPVPAPDGRLTTAIFKSDGTGYTLLPLPDPTLQVGAGDWSSDGTLFVSDGWDDTDPSRVGIYSRNASNGGDLLRLTDAGSRVDFPIGQGAFSPDGSKFLFFRPHAKGETGDAEPLDLFVVNADGGGVRRLTPPGTTTAQFLSGSAASWSPDGTQVAVVAAHGRFWDTKSRSVYIAEADGSGDRRIGPRGNITDASWSPDGAWIALTMGHTADLYLMHPDGSGLVALTSNAADPAVVGGGDFGPKWSPDSSQLLFERANGDYVADLWSIDVDGSDLFQITDTPAGYGGFAFTPSAG